MNKIEKNKKILGVYMLIITFLVYIAQYILIEQSMLKIAISFFCIMFGYVSLSLMKHGITGILVSLFNVSIYTTITYAIQRFCFEKNLPFIPTFILGIVVFSIVYFYIEFPKKLVNFIKKNIFKITEDEHTKNAITYAEYKEAQKVKANVSRRNSVLNLTLMGKVKRIVFLLIMTLFSISLILDGYPVYSLLFLVCGISTFLYGIYNGLKIVLLLQVYIAVVFVIKHYLGITPKRYFEYYFTLTTIGLFNIAFFTRLFVKTYKKSNEYINLVNFKVGDEYKSCDVFLDVVKPITNYDILLKVCADVELDNREITLKFANKMNSFANDLYKTASREQYIIVGTSLDKLKEKSYTFVYIRKEEKENVLKELNKVAANYGYKLYIAEEIEDPKWEYYSKNIFPDKYIVQEIINKNYINMLTNLNVDSNKEHKIFYYFYFENKEQANKFAKEIKLKYYEVESIDNLSSVKENLKLKDNQNYGVIISDKTKLGLQKMNMQTRILIDTAEKFKGNFDGWNIQTEIKK